MKTISPSATRVVCETRLRKQGPASLVLPALLTGLVLAPLCAAGDREGAPGAPGAAKALPTHAQLTARRAETRIDGKFKPATQPIEMKEIRSEKTTSLLARSSIISSGLHWTIVPKEAILHIPKHLTERVNAERTGQLLEWREFLTKNRGWLQTQNVSVAQARGEAPIAEESVAFYTTSGRVVVAVCHEGPISVKPPAKEGEKDQTAGAPAVRAAKEKLQP